MSRINCCVYKWDTTSAFNERLTVRDASRRSTAEFWVLGEGKAAARKKRGGRRKRTQHKTSQPKHQLQSVKVPALINDSWRRAHVWPFTVDNKLAVWACSEFNKVREKKGKTAQRKKKEKKHSPVRLLSLLACVSAASSDWKQCYLRAAEQNVFLISQGAKASNNAARLSACGTKWRYVVAAELSPIPGKNKLINKLKKSQSIRAQPLLLLNSSAGSWRIQGGNGDLRLALFGGVKATTTLLTLKNTQVI